MGSKCGRVLAVAVHDLRTPLAVVAGYLGLLVREQAGPLSRRQRQLILNMEKAAQSLTKIVSDMSDVSNLENRTLPLTRSHVSLSTIVKEASEQIGRAGAGTIVVRGATPQASVFGDHPWLRTAFATIFAATLREIPGEPRIVVRQVVRPARSGGSAFVASGDEHNVKQLLQARAARLTAFDAPGGARNIAAIVACRVIEAHGGNAWMLRGERHGPGVLIRLPLSGE